MNKRITSVILVLCLALSCLSIGSFTAVAKTVENESSSALSSAKTSNANSYGLTDNVQDGQILQAFCWSFNALKDNMKKIAEQGFTAIQTSPIQQAKEGTSGRTIQDNWWALYQPSYFRIDNTGQSALGNKAEFTAMCAEAEKYGVKVIVDAVLNHTANNGKNSIFSGVDPDLKNDSSCWHDISKNSSYKNRYDITQYCMDGVPDLNTSNSKVQNKAIEFMKECIDCGADGFRFDGAKHIETPVDSGFGSDFWTTVLDATTSYAQSTKGITPYYYGETLNEISGSDDKNVAPNVLKFYESVMSVTVNTVGNDIRNKVNSGNASEAIRSDFYFMDGSQATASHAVLWNESHDTYANEGSGSISTEVINKTWALVGSRAESCGMYFARPDGMGQRQGVGAITGWANKEVQAVNQFNNFFVGQSESLSSSNKIAYIERGTSGVVIVNCGGTNASVNLSAKKMKDGTYTDQITGSTFTVSGGKISGQVGSTGIAVVYNAVTKPIASVTPGTQSYKTDSLSLTLSYANATSGQYSIDGGAYQNFTNGQKITIGAGLPYDTVTKVSVKASDGSTTSDIATYTYTKVDPTKSTRIYFDNSSYNWSNVYAYVYSSSTVNNGAWPGVKMEKDSSTGLYYYEVPENLENGYAIFTESADATNNRYPADSEQGLLIGGSSKILKANHTWSDYSGSTPTTAPTTTPATTTPVTTAPDSTGVQERVLIGDVDLNGSVEVRDATLVQLYSALLRTLNAKQLIAGDTDGDGKVNVRDATNIQMYCAHLGDSASVGEYTDGGQITTEPKTEPTTMVSDKTVVYFNNTDNWSKVNVHYWNDSDTTTWPGNEMTKVSGNIYKYEVPNGMKGIIFNNGNGTQTSDLTMPTQSNMMYDYSSNSWSAYS